MQRPISVACIDAPPKQPLIDTRSPAGACAGRDRGGQRFPRRHELRTPLTAIKTHLQVLRLACGESGLHGAAGEALANAQQGVARLHRTLEQLLLLARLEGAAKPEKAPRADALHAAQQAIDDASAVAPQVGGASIRCVELQATTNAASLAIPEALLVSALRNLLDNALRHSPRQSTVVLRIERLPGHVAFCVLDEGPGMSAAEVVQAAQRFWRRGSGSVDGDIGSGLGLSIVDAIARRYGGELHLEPRQVVGMEARLCFPAEE